MIAAMRLGLATSALLAIAIDPSEPDRYATLTYTALGLYVAYSGVVYILARHPRPFWMRLRHWTPWLDVAWYSALIALSSGTNSIFFFGFLFAALTASLRGGFWPGLQVTVASAVIFTVVGVAVAPSVSSVELNRLMLRPVFLLVLGYMMARAGEFQILLNRRLTFLKDIVSLANPRFGVDQMISAAMDKLRSFYDAQSCLMITAETGEREWTLRRADRDDPEAAIHAEPMSIDLTQRLLFLPQDCAVIYERTRVTWPWGLRLHARDVVTGARVIVDRRNVEALATVFDTESFITVPLRHRNSPVGRLYLTGRPGSFLESDLDFLLQVDQQITPLVENTRLVDQLASRAADDERRKIARDIHDSIIQPYVGLEMALVAIRQKLRGDDEDTRRKIDGVIELCSAGIADLRRYSMTLKDANVEREDSLLAALRRFALRFTEVTGLPVEIDCTDHLRISDRLAAETFHMVTEGLSNVRRHTRAARARVHLSRYDGSLRLAIENDRLDEAPPTPFTPRSISERVAALGGKILVETSGSERTVVHVEIPL
jgi:signal transduction histidine kinase